MIMDAIRVYAASLGGIFLLLALTRGAYLAHGALSALVRCGEKHLLYPYLIRRLRWIGPWSRGGVLCVMFFVGVNIFLVIYPSTVIESAVRRAGLIAFINAMPLFSFFHFALGADVLNVSLSTYKYIHRLAALTAVLFCGIHIILWTQTQHQFSWASPRYFNGVIVGLSSKHYVCHETDPIIGVVLFRRITVDLPSNSAPTVV